jgi:hypothetical protein
MFLLKYLLIHPFNLIHFKTFYSEPIFLLYIDVFFLSIPLWSIRLISQFHHHFYRRSPWTGDRPVAMPLSIHRTTQTQNKRIHTPNMHALCGIRTHDAGFIASEDSTCLRPPDNLDRCSCIWWLYKININGSSSFSIGFFPLTVWICTECTKWNNIRKIRSVSLYLCQHIILSKL